MIACNVNPYTILSVCLSVRSISSKLANKRWQVARRTWSYVRSRMVAWPWLPSSDTRVKSFCWVHLWYNRHLSSSATLSCNSIHTMHIIHFMPYHPSHPCHAVAIRHHHNVLDPSCHHHTTLHTETTTTTTTTETTTSTTTTIATRTTTRRRAMMTECA